MQIIVIDNHDWIKFHNAGVIPKPYSISTSDKTKEEVFDELQECYFEWGKNESTAYLINIHCVFKNKKEAKSKEYFMQDQLGVMVYRYLLKAYEKDTHNIKVGFYSPISQDILLKSHPENFVITKFPFFGFPFESNWDVCVKKILEFKSYPVYNTASENLLAGYKILCADLLDEKSKKHKKVEIGNKKITFIDDQAHEWVDTFDEIFKTKSIIGLSFKNQGEFRNILSNHPDSDFIKELEKNVTGSDMILLDFYLLEDHDPSKWMDKIQISNISGFQVFKKIKMINKGLPVVMHTSSNKIPYYKIFDHFGVDDWIVKDSRVNATLDEKRDNYLLFKQTIEGILDNQLYEEIKMLSERVYALDIENMRRWWYSSTPESNIEVFQYLTKSKFGKGYDSFTWEFISANSNDKNTVISILKSSLLALKRLISKHTGFENEISTDDEHFTASAICNNLGKILEFFQIHQSADVNYLFKYLMLFRNAASHFIDYDDIFITDCLIYFDCLLKALESKNTDVKHFIAKQQNSELIYQNPKGGTKRETYRYRMLILHLQFYNCWASEDFISDRNKLKKRIQELYESANKNELISIILKDNGLKKSILERNFSESCEFNKAILHFSNNGKIYIKN